MRKSYWLGKKFSEEHKRNLSIAHKGKKGHPHSEETKKKMSHIAKERGFGKWMKGKKLSEETKKKMGKKGADHPMYGKRHSEEAKAKISACGIGRKVSLETRGKMKLSHLGKNTWSKGKKLSKKTCGKMSESRRGHTTSKETKRKIGEANKINTKKLWKNPSFVRKQMQSRGVKPNKLETSFQQFINTLLPKEYKFVGDGQFILGGKCPDFMNINGQKKLIELYGDYWHRGQDPQKRIDYFKKYGFNTLIIWEKEYRKNITMVRDKVLTFNKAA